jgi:hypothetical protein
MLFDGMATRTFSAAAPPAKMRKPAANRWKAAASRTIRIPDAFIFVAVKKTSRAASFYAARGVESTFLGPQSERAVAFE